MKVIAIARHVPDSRIAARVNSDGTGLEQAGLKFVCDPFDEIGIEQAVHCRTAEAGVDEVIVLSAGGPEVEETLRHGLAMGADRAVRINSGQLRPHEELLYAKLCAAAIRELCAATDRYIVFYGARNTDNGAGELGPALAEMLDLPHAGAVTQFEQLGDSLEVHSRCVTGREVVMRVAPPAVILVERGLIEPRHPALPKLMKAKKQPIEIVDRSNLSASHSTDARLVQLRPPTTRQKCHMIEGEPAQAARSLIRMLREEANVL